MTETYGIIKDFVKILNEVGLESVLNAVIILLGVKYFLGKMNDTKCIKTQEMQDLIKNVNELRGEVKGIRGLLEGIMTLFRYRGRDDE